MAADWVFRPRLGLGTIFTDNLNQDPPGDTESAIVGQATPGFSLSRQGGRLGVNLDSSLQTLYAVPQGDYNFSPSVRGVANSELYKDHLFFDASAYVNRVATSSNRQQGNYSLMGQNSTIASAYNLNPYLLNNFNGYALSRLSYNFSDVLFNDTSNTGNSNVGNAANGQIHQFSASLASGKRFPVLFWQLNYSSYYQNQQQQGQNDNAQSVSAQVGYPLNRALALLARGGYEGGQVSDINTKDGSYGEAGASWTPNRYLGATALYGIHASEFSLRLNPTIRTQFEVSRRKLDVGVNPGANWSAVLQHSTQFSTWAASYSEQVTNAQQQFATQPLFDEQGRAITQQAPQFTLTNQNYKSKNLQGSIGYTRGRSTFTINAYDQWQEYQSNFNNENIYGGGVSWARLLTARTRSLLQGNWYRTDYSGGGGDSDFWVTRIGLEHSFTPMASGQLSYTHFNNSGDNGTNGNNRNLQNNEYRENRIEMNVLMNF
ncbi:MAG: TIGR03016 family PEP-CTERM system-associated outer membrane protein [Candidatus Competibacteraceae bacterium]